MKYLYAKAVCRALILILIFTEVYSAGFRIKGRVFNRTTKEAVNSGFALLKSGTNLIDNISLENDGIFLFDGVETGNYAVEIRSPGFFIETRNIKAETNLGLTIYLTPQSSASLGEIDIIGEKEKGSVSKTVLDKETREKAVASVTGDPVNTLLKMPGVKTANNNTAGGGFGRSRDSSGISVRGGAGLENMALMDETLIDHPYHTIFPDSVFIDDLVDRMTLYKGVIPPQYGQAMSSLLDVKLEDGREGLHGKLDLGLLNAYFTLNGASKDGKWSFSGGIRRTHYDFVGWLLLNVLQPGINTSTLSLPYYLDSQGKIMYKDKNDIVNLIWFYSDEPTKIYLIGTNTPGGNASAIQSLALSAESYNPEGTLNLHWKHIFDNTVSLEQSVQGTISYSYQGIYFTNNTTNNTTNILSSYNVSRENNLHYKALADINIFSGSILKPGGEIIYYPDLFATNVYARQYTNQNTQKLVTNSLEDSGYDGKLGIYSAFLENETYFFDNRLTVSGGLRLNYVDFVNKYSLDPRITVQYEFLPGDKVYGAWGYMSQFPTSPSIVSALETNRSDINIPGCYQYVLGSQLQAVPASTLTIEAYYKDYRNDIAESSNFQLTYVTSGLQRNVFGYELFWMQKPGNFPVYGWIGIGGDFVRELTDANRDLGISKNASLPPVNQWYTGVGQVDYKLNITAVWDINKHWTLTGEFNIQSGAYYTPVTGSTRRIIPGTNGVVVTNYSPVFGGYNSASLPPYHTLNLKLENRGELFGYPYGMYVQVQNVYNDLQVTGYSYNEDYSVRTEQKPLFGIIPTIGFWMEW